MKTMNLGSDEMPEKKKNSNTRNLKIALGLAAVILVPTIGSTLAGSISINAGSGVEFGQGVVTTAACDDSITITPESALVVGTFMATAVAVTNIGDADCEAKFFTVKVLNSSNVAQLTCKFLFGATANATTLSTGPCDVYVSGTTNFTFRPTAPGIESNVVEKITLESSSS